MVVFLLITLTLPPLTQRALLRDAVDDLGHLHSVTIARFEEDDDKNEDGNDDDEID